ncbi:hypothetical protein LTR66_007047 [Elasticomyces elasticus]|nr:hypothetical protein LTR50_006312 [Elasticomyces elasticus]KAK4989498.1 hypothetical protein LTR66_007047 [Elasticomyces elasticus]
MSHLSTRKASEKEQKIIDDILCLYQLKPSEQAYSHYAQNAVFHDPVSIAQGLDSIKSQFNGMPKIFSESNTQKCEVLDEPSQPNSIVLNLTQQYVFKSSLNPFSSKEPDKVVNSKISLKFNHEGLIEKHDEEWDHEPNPTGEDGFIGKMKEWRKKTSAKVVEKTVSSDPSKV